MKKHSIYILFLTFIMLFTLIFCINKVNARSNENNIIIYLDAGHGGFDGGATSLDKLVIEKDVTLNATLILKTYLEKVGYIVKLTREKDLALSKNKKDDIYKRVDLINKKEVDLYISIHANSYPLSSVKGAQTFYSTHIEQNKILAEKIMKYLQLSDKDNKRNAKDIKGKYLLDHTNTTGCLVELGFLTNDKDLKRLTDESMLKETMFMIYLGILEYIEELNI